MGQWYHHPRYLSFAAKLIDRLRSKSYRFPPIRPVIFLCGGRKSDARDNIKTYLSRKDPPVHLFYAEEVWIEIASNTDLTALQMEERIAKLADMVIIVVESPGTFAEIGAFCISSELRTKLLPIVDRRFRESDSFIATGPLRWIDKESKFRPTIYVDLLAVLLGAAEIDERLSRLGKPKTRSIKNLAQNPKYLLFFLCDLINIIGPTNVELIRFYGTS